MSIKCAGEVIREARKRAKLSQEALSEGICSYVTLSNIEKGTYGVSPLTFELLMERVGVYNQVYPIFENLTDYLCFWNIIHARFYLTRWKYVQAKAELKELQEKHFNNNKYYYQQYCLLTAWLEIKTGNNNYLELSNYLLEVLHISKPSINLNDLKKISLSSIEIKIIFLYVIVNLILGRVEESLIIYNQITAYIENARLSEKEKNTVDNRLLLIQVLFDIFGGKYEEVVKKIDTNLINAKKSGNVECLLFMNYAKAACLCKLERKEEFTKVMRLIESCEKAMDSSFMPFAAACLKSLGMKEFPISNSDYEHLEFTPKPDYDEGAFDIYGHEVMTIGSIIKYHREQQKLSAKVLCEGLCGTALLSKIENNTINPDIVLTCTMLNRLGLSEDIFTFYGNKEESLYYDLITKLSYGVTFGQEKYYEALLELKKLAAVSKKAVIKQAAMFYESNTIKNYDEKKEMQTEAIKLTLKDFDIQNLNNYRLSKIEYNLIMMIFQSVYDNNRPKEAQILYQQISNYLLNASFDVMQGVQIFPPVYISYYDYLYSYELYSNIVFDMNISEHPYLSYAVKGKAFVYYIYALALFKVNDLDKAKEISDMAANLLSFLGFEGELLYLQNTIKEYTK